MWRMALVVLALFSARADTQFRARPMTRDDVPRGKGQCDIRLQVDNEIEVAVRGDMVSARTLSGQDARDDGSECNAPLPRREMPDLVFEVKDSRNEIRLVENPGRRNNYAAVVHIRDSAGGFGRYHFRLSWDLDAGAGARPSRDPDRPAAGGFAWNNALSFRGRGRGTALYNDTDSRALQDVTVDIDRGGKVVAAFRSGRGPSVVFNGILMDREGGKLKASVTSEDGRLRGNMYITVDERQTVDHVTLEATDGRDRLHLAWDRR